MATTGAAWIPKLPPTGNRPSSSALSAPKPCGGAASSPCAWPLPWASCSGSPAAGRSSPSASWGLRAATATPAASGLTNTMPAARLWCSCSWGRSWRFPPTTSREAPLTGGPFSPPCLLRASSPASCTPTTSATSRTTARPGSRLSPCCWAAGKPCTCTRPCA